VSVSRASIAAVVALGVAGPVIPETIELDFDFATRQPIVAVRVNGGRPVPFVVDTGASVHVIDSAMAADTLTLAAGGAVWSEQRTMAVPLGYPQSKHFAGLIGAPILMRYVPQFDYQQMKLRLMDPSTYVPPAASVRVPFELQENLPIVHALVDAGNGPMDARLLIDTGASQFVDLNRPFVDAHDLRKAMTDVVAADRPAAVGGPSPFVYGTGRRVTFGGVTFERPRLGLSQARTGSSARSERDGIIGNDLLRRFARVTVDYSRRIVVLEKRAN
jgi:Aspartyl protease